MGSGSLAALTLDEENQRLRDRIRTLEEEVGHLRGSLAAERQNSAGPLAESELYAREVFEQISVCMFVVEVTPDGRFKYAGFNPAEEKVVGLSTAEVSGKYVEEVFAEDLAQKLIRNYRRCTEAGTAIGYNDELVLPAGHRYFYSNLIPVRNQEGRIHRIVGACIDTTDFRRSQQESIARQKLESIGVLAAGIAHDFNNLLGSILSQAELAESEVGTGSSPIQEIETIKDVASRAGEIVRELMIYAGQDEAGLEPVDLSLLVAEMLELLKISISKYAALKVDLPGGLPPIQANPVQIRQVVLNLITNASEAIGDKGGIINVTVSHVESIPDSSGYPSQSDALKFTVSDTGVGMTEAVRARIFDPFYTTKFAGRGLGLAAVQGIVRSHGGSIEVLSTPGLGSTFEILLPCISRPVEEEHGISESTTRDEPLPDVGTVLVVEDEPVLRDAVSRLLRREGFSVIEASDGIEGAKRFADNQSSIDVVLLDITLPGISGWEVWEEVCRLRPDTKVILTSAYSQETVTVTESKAPWGYIRKPYRITELVNVLRRACQHAAK